LLLLEPAVVVAAATAWIPKVVPVMTSVEPPVVTVVVMVAGTGVAVVLLQPDQVPVQEEKGPQPAVQVVQESQLMPLAWVPQGPNPPPGPPLCPPQLPGPPQPPLPPQPLGAEGRPVEQAEIQLDHCAEFQPPLGPKPGPAVIWEGQAEPPEVALKVASAEAVTEAPALAHS
jgi:hypothetical protein